MATLEKTGTGQSVQFYYPTSSAYPIDHVCGRIVLALEKCNWKCNNIEVTFDDREWKSTTYRKVSKIKGDHFSISFGRIQGTICVWPDTAAVDSISIPKKELSVFEDYSGPTLKVHRKDDWIESFWNADPHDVLTYNGGLLPNGEKKYYWGPNYTPIRSSLILQRYRDNPSAMNTDRTGDTLYYKTKEIFDQFVHYLEEKVLKPILEGKA